MTPFLAVGAMMNCAAGARADPIGVDGGSERVTGGAGADQFLFLDGFDTGNGLPTGNAAIRDFFRF